MSIDVSKFGLPVADILPALMDALSNEGQAVLVAPPGAGKTTLVPLALLTVSWRLDGTIIVLEPRRLAARAAARRIAFMLGEEVGQTVGYRMRLDQKVSAKTRILVVTEGVFARMAIDDSELKGVAAVLFDEFHERSLDADLGLALALDIRDGLRPDLRILVMSATLDGARIAGILGNAQVIESQGRAFAVDVLYSEKRGTERIEDTVARIVADTLATRAGSILVFLPGTGEINTVARLIEPVLTHGTRVHQLHGSLDSSAQDDAIKPAPSGTRKVVLATSIAETSITIDGVTIVIDSGYQRLPVFEPASGLTRLETVRASKASVDQRAGRAGRTAPGTAIRLWRMEQNAVLPAFTPPEILDADLTGLLLDLAAFGVNSPASLRFLDQPPEPALHEARELLLKLDAINADGRLTEHGRLMRQMALPVRLSHMVIEAAKTGQAAQAADIALLLTERGLGGNDVDIETRLVQFRREKGPRADAARTMSKRLSARAHQGLSQTALSCGALLLHAYPDRLAKSRGQNGRFVMANGRGVEIDVTHALAAKDYLVIANTQGTAQRSRILSAAEVSLSDIETVLAGAVQSTQDITFDRDKKSLRRHRTRRLGAVILDHALLSPPSGTAANAGLIEAVRQHGLNILDWSDLALTTRKRLGYLHASLSLPWPDISDTALLRSLEDWVLPFLNGKAQIASIPQDALTNGLRSMIPHNLLRVFETLAPTHFVAPTGNTHQIRYDGDEPVLAIRIQELFGLKVHPAIAGGEIPLLLELLSPAHRPVQLTRDLPGFWAGSWGDVRSDLRGRYPRHFWPQDPANAAPTARAKPRGT